MNTKGMLRLLLSVGLLLLLGSAAHAEELSAQEQRTYQLFESYLSYLNMILAIVGGAFVLLQIIIQAVEFFRQNSLQSQTRAFLENSTNLINAMAQMIEINNKNQEATRLMTQQVQEALATVKQHAVEVDRMKAEKEEERQKAFRRLEDEVTRFARRFNRFKARGPQLKQLEGVRKQIEKYQADYPHDPSPLPAEVALIQGYVETLENSNNEAGARQFRLVAESEQADPELRERARLNLAVNLVNMGQYDRAVREFALLEQLNPNNLLYLFYRLETQLFIARQSGAGNGAGPDATDEIEQGLRTLLDATREEGYEYAPESQAAVQVRASRALGSLLTEKRKYDQAERVLGERFLEKDSSALFLRLRCRMLRSGGRAEGDDGPLNDCLTKANAEFANKLEKRSKLLQGMIGALCYAWKGDPMMLNERKENLLFIAEEMKKEGASTVFSVITQRNESIDTILQQIRNFAVAREEAVARA